MRRVAVRFIAWLGLTGSFIVKAIAFDRLATASRTCLDVAARNVQHATRRSAIVALCETHRILLKSIGDTIVFLAVDRELFESLRFRQPSLPFLFPICASHRPNETEVSYRHRGRAVLEIKRF